MNLTITPTNDLAACHAVRRAVFIEEQNVSEAEEVDGRDADALHILALDGDTPVGTARILISGTTAKIGRVAVLKSHRGTGLGQKIMGATLDLAATQPGVTQAALGAQTHAIGFYEALGFITEGPEFMDAGIPHRHMVRVI